MTVEAIQQEIQHLTSQERRKLANWFDEMEERAWDEEMERDFAPGGRGRWLVEEAEAQIRDGRTIPLEQVLEEARARRLGRVQTQPDQSV